MRTSTIAYLPRNVRRAYIAGLGIEVGATPAEIATSADCGNADVTKTVLAELGIASKQAFADRIGFSQYDPKTCIGLALAAKYHQAGKSVDDAIKQAREEAPAMTKEFLGTSSSRGISGILTQWGVIPLDAFMKKPAVAATVGIALALIIAKIAIPGL